MGCEHFLYRHYIKRSVRDSRIILAPMLPSMQLGSVFFLHSQPVPDFSLASKMSTGKGWKGSDISVTGA